MTNKERIERLERLLFKLAKVVQEHSDNNALGEYYYNNDANLITQELEHCKENLEFEYD